MAEPAKAPAAVMFNRFILGILLAIFDAVQT
jgi:hypothetical protein